MDIAADTYGSASAHSLHTRKLIALIGGLFALAFAIAIAALVHIAYRLNADESQQSYFYAQKALQARITTSQNLLTSYAVWNSAYQHLNAADARRWAFEERNLGESLFTLNGYEGVFVLDRQATHYALFNGQPTNAQAQTFVGTALLPIIEAAQAHSESAAPVSRYALFNGWPALLSASAILPDDGSAVPDAARTRVLLFADLLSPEKVSRLGDDYDLPHLLLESHDTGLAGKPRLPLGDTGYDLTWEPRRPGSQLLWSVVPPLTAAVVVLCLLMAWLFRYALRTSEQIDDSYRVLKISNRALEASEERFRAVAEAASDWIWETDAQGRLSYLSTRFTVVTGFTGQDWLGQPIEKLLTCETMPLGQWLRTLDGTGGSLRCAYRDHAGQLRYCRVSARAIHGDGQVQGFRGTASDVTDEVAAHAQIQHLSLHDALTGLANRNKLTRYFEEAGARLPGPTPLTLILLDLDNFKPINDALGHPVGDAVLLEVATRLRECTREHDLVARLGGDEFVLVLNAIDSDKEIDRFCARLIESLHRPILHQGQRLHIGASLGIAQSSRQGLGVDELIRCADIALYQAKAAGKNTWRYFSEHMNQQIQQRRHLENELRQAIGNQEFVLHFQPRYRVDDMQIVSAEALVRWQHPVRGLLGPDTFIALAEQTELIVPLGRWVLHQACLTARQWPEPMQVSVNLSPAQFSHGDVVHDVREILMQTGFPAHRLELEVTENVMFNDVDGALHTLKALKELGVRLNMDDFGTGYSSLGYLRTYPFDSLKIDKRFIAAMDRSGGDRAVVQAIINLGKAMGLMVTAEGVETEQQLHSLSLDLCHEVQGFYLSRPLDARALELLFEAQSPARAMPVIAPA
ncbi:bifunctional diguanylate cyclase/phosphodiesterase [Pseudomonas abieticivorans]|uniref:bifunctional diguanylate cyclase/phosphodiesterase n=1 Tax=Pseudomonas abieticivorans TaxID=2931382 RepID=UPI0020C13CE3|nr:EAL domain-containing protein [Pseudomonas sp. PIA16]